MESILNRLAAKPIRTVLALSLLLFLSGNWILPLIDRDEPRFAEASREMWQHRDFIVPTLNGDFRFDKPPLIYWCQIASYRLLGETPFAARLPSALFATSTALLLVLWGRRMGNQKAGFYAALIFITCLQMLVHGRLSVADIPMIFFVTASAWIGWELTRPQAEHKTRLWWLFYICMGLGFLAKGPVAWLPIAGLVLGRILRPKEFRLPLWTTLAGFVVVFCIVGSWGIPALIQTKGEFLKVGLGRHVVQRSFDVVNGHGAGGVIGWIAASPLFFLTFFLSFFPWALKVPANIRRWWGSRKDDTFGWYLAMQALLIFIVFSIVRTKLPHYTLPAFPLIAFWLGLQLSNNGTPAETDPTSKWVALINKLDRAIVLPKAVAAMTVTSLSLTLVGFTLVAPHIMTHSLWQKVRPYAKPETRVAIIGFGEDSVEWEFRQVVTNYIEHISVKKAEAFLKKGPPCVLIVPTAELSQSIKDCTTNAIQTRVTGIDTTYLKYWDMTALIQP